MSPNRTCDLEPRKAGRREPGGVGASCPHQTLTNVLKNRIAEGGPMSVAEYMEACLLHPAFGYYTTREPFGTAGDFTTAPEISQLFGEILGAYIAHTWLSSYTPQGGAAKPGGVGAFSPPHILLELGPGRGTLMRDVLRSTKNIPGFHDAADVMLCEASPRLEAIQRETLATAHPRTSWIHSLEIIPPKPLFFIANEFFDALPIRQYVGDVERKITLENDVLRFTPEGEVTREVCEPATHILTTLCTHMARYGGAGLIIDYGYIGGSCGDTLQAVRGHAYANPLENSGESDITAHVDFSALAEVAHAAGLRAELSTQRGFLMACGIELRAASLCARADLTARNAILSGLHRLIAPEEMGELFKVLAISAPPPKDESHVD